MGARWVVDVRMLAAAGSLAVGEACSGDWSFALPPAEAGTPATRYEDACGSWASAYCAYEERCFPTSLYFNWHAVAECVARETLGCELAATDPSAQFDEERVRACRYPDDCSSSLPTCFAAGRAPAGSACLWQSACQSGVCVGAGGDYPLCGTCYACNTPCPSGETCTGIVGSGICHSHSRPAGQSCSSADDCQSASCGPGDGGPSVCAPFGRVGESCGGTGPRCDDGAFCDDSGRCSAYRLADDAGRCGLLDDGDDAFAYCGGSAACVSDSCVAPVGDGASCDPSQGLRCLWPAACVAGHCIFPTIADCPP
jgi:hypothetical protein